MNKPNCYECKWRRPIPGNAHSECRHPKINDSDRILAPLLLAAGIQNAPTLKRLNVTGGETGIRGTWFMWPLNFDPTWLLTCDGFELKEVS